MSVPPDSHNHNDLNDEDLVLYYYGETRRGDEIRRRLESSTEARARYDELCRVLRAVETLPVPEPDVRYGERVWNRLQADLREERSLVWWKRLGKSLAAAFTPPRLKAAGALAALLAAAFLAGRLSHLSEGEDPPILSAEGRERIMMSVVATHLERSQRLLLELANAPGDAAVDVSRERESAEELLGDNRVYRQTTRRSGQADMTAVLDQLERILLDLVHGPEEVSAVDLEDFRSRIDDILFKVQVLGWRLRQQDPRQPRPAPPGALAPSREGNQA